MGERRRRASAAAAGGGVRAEEEKATVWFSLKKSLHCRSAPSEVHVPRPKQAATPNAGHLSSIVAKRAAARSGCSRSIANLRDVIHGSKRHPGQPPSCNSPRSIGSSEFLNPIAHEVVLTTNSRCELKITGFASEGVASSFVGTLGPVWAGGHGLQYSGSCRGGVQCTPPRSPNVLLQRNGLATAHHRASCEENAAKGGKGCGGGEQFGKWEAHHLSKHAGLTSLIVHGRIHVFSWWYTVPRSPWIVLTSPW
jgi:hypothetical protein